MKFGSWTYDGFQGDYKFNEENIMSEIKCNALS